MIRSEKELLDDIERSTAVIHQNALRLDREANEQMGLLSGLRLEMQVRSLVCLPSPPHAGRTTLAT